MADKGLTKEYFDKSLKGLRVSMIGELKGHTEQGIKNLKSHVDVRLEQQSKDLKSHVTKEIEKVGFITAKGFEDVPALHVFREEIEKLKHDNRIIKEALHITI